MDALVVGLFVAGLCLLLAGAELLVRGASRLAAAVGVSPLIIGLTVVAWGTGSPELAVGVKAALAGQPDLTVGNVVGSNIANVLLILGLAALVAPLTVAQRLVRLEVPLMAGASCLTLGVALDGTISWLDGLLFVAGIVGYTVWSIRESRRTRASIMAEYAEEFGGAADARPATLLVQGGLVAGGLVLLVLGSGWMVDGATAIAEALGLGELVIGLTIVAIGTSLPEVATSIVASWKGERDIAVGNAVGSNLFNLLAVLGVTALVAPDGISVSADALALDIPIMIVVAVACLPIFFAGTVISRAEGALFLACYGGYLTYLVLAATSHPALASFTTIMVLFVLPLTGLILLSTTIAEVRKRRRRRGDEPDAGEPGTDEPMP